VETNGSIQSSGKFLIWSVCFGWECRRLAGYWLTSLLQIGHWTQDIVLLGDHRILSLRHPQLRTFEIVKDLERKYSFPRKRWTVMTCQNWKPEIQFYVDLRQYDYILFLDLDVLINSDRLEQLIKSKWQRNKICIQRDIVKILADRVWTGRDILTSEEKTRWANEAICSGIVGAPTNEWGLALLKDWHDLNKKGKFRKSEQANLIALLLRDYIEKWEYIGDSMIGRVRRYDETLIHFSARNYELFRTYYQRVLHLPEPEGPRLTSFSTRFDWFRRKVDWFTRRLAWF